MTRQTLRIALLLCDTPLPAVLAEYGNYLDIYREWLHESLKSYPDQVRASQTQLVVHGYDVVSKMEYPSSSRLQAGNADAYDIIMMTGSRHTAHDQSNPFIPPLISFIREMATSPQTQHIKLVGICFGHQIISLAMGGACVPGENGWEIGVYGNELTEEGRYWWCGDETGEGEDRVYVQQMHRDHVPALPPDFHLLLKTSRYPVHSMIKYYSTPSSLGHILTIQGHPEFRPGIVAHMVDARSEQGIFDPPTTAEARRRLGGRDGSGGEGYGRIGWAICRFMLQPGENSVADSNSRLEDGERARSRFAAVDNVLDRMGPWTDHQYGGGSAAKAFLCEKARLLVIGAGGLGCEILQNLALTGFSDIHVIDMDTIDISNLNRQFLFREADVGKSKALTAARFVMGRVPGVKVTPYHSKIQDHAQDFYSQFDIIIAGLDSIAARRWINATLVDMVDPENEDSLKPLIDGGTEGFKGQARVILPTVTSCYECSIDMLAPPTAFPICTIANTPRLPEHCIEWASVLQWPKVKDQKLDTDDPDHIEWLFQQAASRAAEFSIEGVTWALTQGVVKNIIPAIASTNAIIAASCCNEALKIATTCAPFLSTYMMYTGNDSIYTYTFEHEKRPECPVCGGESATVKVGRDWTLERLVEYLKENQDFKLPRPSISGPNGPLFWQEPPGIYEATKLNLIRPLGDLLEDGSALSVTDRTLPAASLNVEIRFED